MLNTLLTSASLIGRNLTSLLRELRWTSPGAFSSRNARRAGARTGWASAMGRKTRVVEVREAIEI